MDVCFAQYVMSYEFLGCLDGQWGVDCARSCDCVVNQGTCDVETGQCNCNPGTYVTNTLAKCQETSFIIIRKCNAIPTLILIASSSTVAKLCSNMLNFVTGFHGPRCNHLCPQGTFGSHCTQRCQCDMTHARCDPLTGECVCDDGYHGPL